MSNVLKELGDSFLQFLPLLEKVKDLNLHKLQEDGELLTEDVQKTLTAARKTLIDAKNCLVDLHIQVDHVQTDLHTQNQLK